MLTLMVPGRSRKVRCLCGNPLPTYWLRGSVAVQLRCPYCGSMFVARTVRRAPAPGAIKTPSED